MPMLEMKVSPANCQIALVVPDTTTPAPEWETGRELVVANAGAIYVATRCDVDGEVAIEVWMNEPPHQHREPIYDGVLQIHGVGALVGSLTGNHLGWLSLLQAGDYRVRVYTDPPGAFEAERVYFVMS